MEEKRTSKQNRALHKYCEEVSRELQGSGVTVQEFIQDIQADFEMETVKMMWRAFAKAKFGKTSTTQLTRKQINQVYEEVNRHVAKFGIHIAFPSEELTDNYLKSYEKPDSRN